MNNYLYGFMGIVLGLIIGAFLFTGPQSVEVVEVPREMTMQEMMDAMNASLVGKTGDEFDEMFLHEMIMHHEGAVAMAELAFESTEREELLDLSREIIEAQEAEIEMMKTWLEEWGFSDHDIHLHH